METNGEDDFFVAVVAPVGDREEGRGRRGGDVVTKEPREQIHVFNGVGQYAPASERIKQRSVRVQTSEQTKDSDLL